MTHRPSPTRPRPSAPSRSALPDTAGDGPPAGNGPPAGDGRPGDDGGGRPFDLIGRLAIQEVEVAPGLHHVEVYTRGGLLTLLWHGDRTEDRYVLMGGGAMGGLLGPGDGAFHDLGVAFAAAGIGTVRVGYRQPNDLAECVLDMAAAADLAARAGGERFVTVGHSFGGAVAIGCALALPEHVVGVVTLSTQSAGCEGAAALSGTPLLLLHGDRDEILPPMCSEVVNALAGGTGEVVIVPGAGHLLNQQGAGTEVRDRLLAWIPRTLAGAPWPVEVPDPQREPNPGAATTGSGATTT